MWNRQNTECSDRYIPEQYSVKYPIKSLYIQTRRHTHTHKIDITVFIIHTYIQKPLNGICDSFLTIRFHQSGKRDYYKSI